MDGVGGAGNSGMDDTFPVDNFSDCGTHSGDEEWQIL